MATPHSHIQRAPSLSEQAYHALCQRITSGVLVLGERLIGYAQRHAGEHIRLSHQEHLRILEALVSRDLSVARQAMEQHIRHAGERITQLIDFRNTSALERAPKTSRSLHSQHKRRGAKPGHRLVHVSGVR